MVFFANTVAVTLYCDSDTIMLGTMCDAYYVGLYAVAVKIYTVFKNIGAAVIVVTIPRLANYYQEDTDKWKNFNSDCRGIYIIFTTACYRNICFSKTYYYFFGRKSVPTGYVCIENT